MRLEIFTLALDAMPFITWHLPIFERLEMPWRWTIAEGAADNVHDTAWCRPQEPRLSRDGTTEYLNSIMRHPRVRVVRSMLWDGKVEMCNACIEDIRDPCVLMQIDADECWEAWQLTKIYDHMTPKGINCMRFWCRYYLGPNIVATSTNGYGNRPGEWLRTFLFEPGMRWKSHEPPFLIGVNAAEHSFSRDITLRFGLGFLHFAYYFESQVRYKEQFYGYTDAVKHWRRLQENTVWPVTDLRTFLPWVGENASADLLHR